jgi:signal transduction histidine kinase
MGPELETTIFRIVQEALTNVYRHAEARKVCIGLELSENQIVVTVSDDGKGLPASVTDFEANKLGVGIAGMKQRVKELGGELRLRNNHPGALVEAIIPTKIGEPRSAEQQLALPRVPR